MSPNLVALLYLVSGVLFILALRGLSSPVTSRQGNLYGMIGMTIAVLTTLAAATPSGLLHVAAHHRRAGRRRRHRRHTARKIPMTMMPELVAAFHSLVGLAAVFVAAGALYAPEAFGIGTPGNIAFASLLEMSLGVAIGAITFTGSVIAFAKLSGRMSGKPIILPARHVINGGLAVLLLLLIYWFCESGGSAWLFWAITIRGAALRRPHHHPDRRRRHAGRGVDAELVLGLGGRRHRLHARQHRAHHHGRARRLLGRDPLLHHVQGHEPLVPVGDRGRLRRRNAGPAGGGEQKPVKLGSAEDAAYIMKNAQKVIIVPGYGMAVAQAQHALREMAENLKKAGVEVKYAIHPVAGRMPGHMNVLLAEANVPYDEVFELEDINTEFQQSDVAYVIGANDVTNPAAEDDKTSPIYGMPVLQVWKAGTVMFNKRSLASGYAGIDNPLFYRDNTMMLLGDAKKMTEEIVKGMAH